MSRGHPDEWIDKEGKSHKILDVEKAFVDAYLGEAHYNAQEAYKIVYGGCASNTSTATRLYWRPAVQEYLKFERKRIFDERCIDKMRVLDRLADIAFAEKGDTYYNANQQVRALDMLGKWCGLFEDEKKSGTPIRITLEE